MYIVGENEQKKKNTFLLDICHQFVTNIIFGVGKIMPLLFVLPNVLMFSQILK